jgi:restriction endonuclease Mrr
MDKNEVNTAFEILLEEIEEVFNLISKDGEVAFKGQDFDKAKRLIESGERLKAFREKVKVLQEEWQTIFADKVLKTARKRKTKEKLKRGLRTPEKEFVNPILEALVELGGKAEMRTVLDRVYKKMDRVLNQYDIQHLPSDPRQKRWENTVQWARYALVNKGLLAADSPRGIWEITKEGEKYLKN